MQAIPIRLAAYRQVANLESNPLQQIVMLYDGAVRFINMAAEDIEAGDVGAKAEHTNRALDIINYLQSILDFERGGSSAPALDAFYKSLSSTILQASVSLNAEQMRRAIKLIAPVREAWETIASRNGE